VHRGFASAIGLQVAQRKTPSKMKKARSDSRASGSRFAPMPGRVIRLFAQPILAPELVDATARIKNLLFARKERMTLGTHLDLQVFAHG
jgi:hypothetical protein